ncbi:MAG: hypothetical protein RLZ98_191 [Pseudomonadota bacterium]|jgi:alpha-ketoglutarate-dependent taurine dioxygenase
MTVADTAIRVEPLSKQIGGRVTGVDLTKVLPEETISQIRDAFHAYSVLLFPAQEIGPDDQIRFAAMFGKADGNAKSRKSDKDKLERQKGIMYVTNIRENGVPIGSLPDGEMHFHADGAHRQIPYRCTTLYAQRLPSRGGETKFANLYAAYEALPVSLKERLEGRKALYAHETSATLRDQIKDLGNPLVNQAVHNLVSTHPVTGRKSLYMSRLMTRISSTWTQVRAKTFLLSFSNMRKSLSLSMSTSGPSMTSSFGTTAASTMRATTSQRTRCDSCDA